MALSHKIDKSIELIRNAESLALRYNDYGFHLAFSGGKDSQVIYELCKMAGVKFKAFFNVTTIDPPELMKFIRNEYSDVIFNRPKINFYDLIVKKQMLPLRNARYCCQYLKEGSGSNSVVILGVRKQESNKRAKRNELEISGRKYSNTFDQFNIDFEKGHTCVNGKDKIMLMPILDLTFSDVWKFIRGRDLKYCSLYDNGYTRIGCMFCPMASVKTKRMDRKRYPKIELKIKESIQKCIENNGYGNNLSNDPNEIFEWWISNKTIQQYKADKTQMKMIFDHV